MPGEMRPSDTLPEDQEAEVLKSSWKSRFPNWGLVSTVGVILNVAVGMGVFVGVGGNQTIVGVGVTVGPEAVSDGGGGGRGINGAQEDSPRRSIWSSNKT